MRKAVKDLPEGYIKTRFEQGETIGDLAKEYKTHRPRIARICGVIPDGPKQPDEPEDEQAQTPAPGNGPFYPINIQLNEIALDFYIGQFSAEEKAIALEAVLVARVG